MLYWYEREVAYLINTFAHPVENVLIDDYKAVYLRALMYAGFAEKMWALYCNAGHPVMENIVYQLF